MKLRKLVAITLCALTLAGCSAKTKENKDVDSKPANTTEKKEDKSSEKKEDKSGEKTEAKKLDAEKIVTANFGKEDKLFDFRVKTTENFLKKYDIIAGELDSKYAMPGNEPVGFNKVKEQSQLVYQMKVKDYDNKYQYIMELKYGLFFNDDKSQITFQELNLRLCDDNKDGKIELNDKSKKILTTFYPKINLEEAQSKINESVEASKNKDFKSVKLESVDKYNKVYFSWFKYKDDTPVEVNINMQTYEDYPRQ